MKHAYVLHIQFRILCIKIMDIPCSVNTYGSVCLPPLPSLFSGSCIFEVPDWHFKDSVSSIVS